MGCSVSKMNTSTLVTNKFNSDVRPHPVSSKRFIENCLIIWLDNERSQNYREEKDQLNRFVSQLKIFDNDDQCLNLIDQIEDERIFLILSDRNASSIDRFGLCEKIERIYFYDSNSSISVEIYRNIDSLWKQLRDDLEQCEFDLISVTTLPISSTDLSLLSTLNKQEASFLLPQALKEIIYRLKFESESKEILVEFCRTNYSTNDEQLRLIEEFAVNYRPIKALTWLKNSSFISKILHRVHRTFEIDLIYKLGFFIKQINIQLMRLTEENHEEIEKVFRAKTMSNEEFHQLIANNLGGLLTFNTFLLASTRREIAMDFLYQRSFVYPDRIRILFEIDLRQTRQKSFAFLSESKEICFDLSTIFRIDSIVETMSNLWTIQLKLVENDDSQRSSVFTAIHIDELHTNPVFFLAKLFMDMGEYRRAEQFLFSLLQNPSIINNPRRLTRVQKGLATIYTHRQEFSKALEQYEKVLQTMLIYLSPDHVDLSPVYRSIGDCYLHQSNLSLAIEFYEKAMNLANPNQVEILIELQKSINKAKEPT